MRKLSIFDLSPDEMVLLATVLGLKLSKDLTSNQQSSLGNLLQLVGQVLITYNGQQLLLQNNIKQSQESNQSNGSSSDSTGISQTVSNEQLLFEIEMLKRRITELERKM